MLVNGKTLEQVRAELSAPERKAGEKEGKPYYEHWQFKKRMDSVLGLNYSTQYTQVQTVTCGKQTLMSCVCTITILSDEDFKPVIRRSGVGGREFKAYQSGNGYANFQSTPSFTERAAFCEACKEFGVFGNFESGGGKVSTGTNSASRPSTSANSTGAGLKSGAFVTHSVMTSTKRRNGEVVYSLNALDSNNAQKEVVFYENQYKKVGKIFDDFREYLLKLKETKSVIVCGDLNVAHPEIDLKNPKTNRQNAGFSDEERGKMTALLHAGFTDTFRYFYPDKTDAYSWWSYIYYSYYSYITIIKV